MIRPGAQLAHYEILSAIGKGGMGEVWRARDTNLGREVAIKTLPDAFARDADRVARFEREARLLATLNHAHIAAIYGLEEDDGARFLALELVEGPTLADRIREGAIPVEESLDLALQIAEALEAAHGKGVVHRDLKPANIKLTKDGQVKVLDFGLARAYAGAGAGASVSQSPTLSMAATRQGIILGTAAYMPPEQARGQEVDARADVWSFGCVLFEMLTGRQAFPGNEVTDVLAAVIRAEPDWTGLPSGLHPGIGKLLRRCLEKDPRRRWHSIADVRLEIEAFRAEPVTPPAPAAGAGPVTWRRAAVFLILAAALGAALGVIGDRIAGTRPAPPVRPSYLEVPIEPLDRLGIDDPRFHPLSLPVMTLSPDGRQIVLAGSADGVQQLFLRPLDSPRARPIAGTGGAMYPVFSPDGAEVAYVARNRIWKVTLPDGLPVEVASLVDAFPASDEAVMGLHWTADGNIVFGQLFPGPGALWTVAASSGAPRPLTEAAPGTEESSHVLPWVLPGGDAVLYTLLRSGEGRGPQVVVESLADHTREILIENATHPVYTASGHLLFMRQGELWAAPFDPDTRTLGEAVPILPGVTHAIGLSNVFHRTGAGQWSVSGSGSLAYLPGGVFEAEQRELVWIDPVTGQEEPIDFPPGPIWNPRVSPDGDRIAVESSGVYIHEANRGTRRLPGGGSSVGAWSGDGQRIVMGGAGAGLVWQFADGRGPAEPLGGSPEATLQFAGAWAPGTAEVLVVEQRPGTGADIMVLDTSRPEDAPRPVLAETYDEAYPALSPDGDRLAYASTATGTFEVHVVSYPDLDYLGQISRGGGVMPTWSPAGDRIFYMTFEPGLPATLMRVVIEREGAFRPSPPGPLFEGSYLFSGYIRSYDVAPDGRFLMTRQLPADRTEASLPLRIVLDFFELLRERAPGN